MARELRRCVVCRVAFNSLFEMQTGVAADGEGIKLKLLSILYLRC